MKWSSIDFPNVIYVLAMDREVVRSALAEVHNIDGDEYLEKIIQVPFELPELRKTKLHDIFCTKLDQIIRELPSEVIWDQQYWYRVFHNCVEPYINTIRDINRVINTFQFKYGMLYQETAFEDMVGITTIEVLEPELYKWVRNNKESVCGGLLHSFLSTKDQKIDYRKQYIEEFTRIGIDPNKSIKCVSTMFPVFAKDVDEYGFTQQDSSRIRERMRAAHEGRFDLYFMLDMDDVKVPRSIINACINSLNDDAVKSTIEEINKQGNIIFFLEELQELIEKIPYERLGLIIRAMIDLQGKFQGESSRALFTLSAYDIADNCIKIMLRELNTEDERNNIICIAANHVNKYGLGAIARILKRIELSYGRLSGTSEKQENQIISLEQLEKLEQIFVIRVQNIASSESLLELSDFGLIFHLWESFNKESAQKYLSDLLKDDSQKLKFVCAIAGRWHGTNGSGWSFHPKQYSPYLSDEEIYGLIQQFDKKRINAFSTTEQLKLASFVLNYGKDEMDYVNEQEAMELVEKWKYS